MRREIDVWKIVAKSGWLVDHWAITHSTFKNNKGIQSKSLRVRGHKTAKPPIVNPVCLSLCIINYSMSLH